MSNQKLVVCRRGPSRAVSYVLQVACIDNVPSFVQWTFDWAAAEEMDPADATALLPSLDPFREGRYWEYWSEPVHE